MGADSYVNANQADPGLMIETNVLNLDSIFFNLNNNQSTTFDFFKIKADESAVNADDQNPSPILAGLDFDLPDEMVLLTGQTVGELSFTGFFQNGALTWDGPVVVTSGGRIFQVELSDETFSSGSWWGLGKKGATVTATVTQLRSGQGSPVPAPAAPLLVMVGLGLVGWLKRRIT